MSDPGLSDFSAELSAVFHGRIQIQVEKTGGGTFGRSYDGLWRYVVTDVVTGVEIARGGDFHSGVPVTHQHAAEIIFDIISNRFDDMISDRFEGQS